MLKNSTIILIITIVILIIVVSFLGYQIYQLNNNFSLLKSSSSINGEKISSANNVPGQQSSLNSNETQFSQPLSFYNTLSLGNQLSEQSGQQSGTGGGQGQGSQAGQGGQGGQGGGFQSAIQNPITSALIPDPFSLLSVILRTSIIALLVFVIVKWLGGKGIGQLSPFGLLIVVGLGSAIGDPMIYNEISIPQAMMAVIIAVVFFKIIDYLTLKSKRFRESVEPNPILLVDHGQIDKVGLKKAKMDKEEFEIEMRLAGIEDVNEVKFSRLEPNGRISFILRSKEKEGK